MFVIPAVDVLGGKVVRLQRGEREKVQVYYDDPAAAMKHWAASGARMIHLVNLDGAFGDPVDLVSMCGRFAREVSVPFQVGGGIRNADLAEAYLNAGAARVVLGTSTVRDSEGFLRILQRIGGERVVVAIDVKNGRVATHGWTSTSQMLPNELATLLRGLGVGRVLVTDVARDGMMSGPNIELMKDVAQSSSMPVLASGGISSLEDLRRLKNEAGKEVEAAIVGKALYEGKIRLQDVEAL